MMMVVVMVMVAVPGLCLPAERLPCAYSLQAQLLPLLLANFGEGSGHLLAPRAGLIGR